MATDSAEVVVVGARCAGAATALLLARQGHDVLLVDRARFPSDTLSGHGLARSGVVQLARWGVLDAVVASGAPKVRSVRYRIGERDLDFAVPDRFGVDFLLAPRRYAIDAILLDAAIEAGARFESGTSVTGVTRDATGRVDGVVAGDRTIGARIVIGADGVRSRIARAVGAGIVDQRPAGAACHYAYVAGLDADGYELHVGVGAFAGIFPTHGGEATVWGCVPAAEAVVGAGDRREAYLGLLHKASPSLAERVAAGRFTAPVRGAVALPNVVRQAFGPGWTLVGDAGYHRDPITGHGMSDAFRDAELLADALGRALRGEAPEPVALAAYAADRDRALAAVFDLTCELITFPPPERFLTLQFELNVALEAEAAELAARPPLPQLAGV